MDPTTTIYLIIFFLGLIYTIIAGLFADVLNLATSDHDLHHIVRTVNAADFSVADLPTFSPIDSVTLTIVFTTFAPLGSSGTTSSPAPQAGSRASSSPFSPLLPSSHSSTKSSKSPEQSRGASGRPARTRR